MTAGKRAASAGLACSSAEWIRLAGQDDREFVTVELTGFGQDLVHAAEDVLAVVGQVVPGVRASDRSYISAASPARSRRSIPALAADSKIASAAATNRSPA